MRHERALEKLDELDRGEEPGLALRLHLAACPSCARAAALSAAAIESYSASGRARDAAMPAAARDDYLEDRIMAAVRLTPPPKQDFAIRDWLFPAAVILLSLCFLPFASNMGIFDALFGEGFVVSLALALAVMLTGYSIFFIATHMDELETFLEKKGVTLH
jgi:hypothetical protein